MSVSPLLCARCTLRKPRRHLWRCRKCARQVCEHLSHDKGSYGIATCDRCVTKKGTK